MTKTEYLESQRGNTYTEIVANQPMETVIGSIRGDNLRNVVDILAKGLQDRLDFMVIPDEAKPIRTALIVVFRYLTLKDYQINLAIQENADLLRAAEQVGLVTAAESAKFFELASYQRSQFDITRQDCINYFSPDWTETAIVTDATTLNVDDIRTVLPEVTHIIVEYQDALGNWYHATALHGIQAAIKYSAALPYYGQPRKLRWKCEYALDATVWTV